MYALAASAAGVSVLALSQQSEAKIVYTPAHKNIGRQLSLDLNHDGIPEFRFRYTHKVGSGGTVGKLDIYQSTLGARIYGPLSDPPPYVGYAAALKAGIKLGPSLVFRPRHYSMAEMIAHSGNNRTFYGFWGGYGEGVKKCYLGLQFHLKDKVHYGWARLNVAISQGAKIKGLLTGYAYETVPNKAIVTGKTKGSDGITIDPSSLYCLAGGAATLPMRRAHRKPAHQ
jgi:hypothetical protein